VDLEEGRSAPVDVDSERKGRRSSTVELKLKDPAKEVWKYEAY
jgi:hypothetical protein